jgi:hypothetical protein
MVSINDRVSRVVTGWLLLAAVAVATSFAQDISSTPSSWEFQNTYIGQASGNKVLTITNLLPTGQIVINTVGFDCADFGLASGVAPFTLGQVQKTTHYSIFFQPSAAQNYSCNFVLTLSDGTTLDVPVTGSGLASTGTATLSTTSLSFSGQTVGTTSTGRTVTITNNGVGSVKLEGVTPSSPSFTTSALTLPYTIAAGSNLPFAVFYTPSQVTSESGALALSYDSLPDNGVALSGNGVASTPLVISTAPTLPQATQNAAYLATLATSGGTAPYTWKLTSGSTLPSGLTLSSAGVISGTVASTVAAGTYTFTVKASDAKAHTASSLLTLGVYANLGDNCNDLTFDVPGTSTPMVALNDLGTGTYQGSEGGLYSDGSNVRPAGHDSDGVGFADAIQPLNSSGNPSPTGKYVLLAVGESTAQNEFNTFLPIANADPAKNPNLVLVNGAQGGATPNNLTSTTSVYWSMVLNNYLPQNGVTANQVVAIWMEDTDGIATGTFPTDISSLQTEYETLMQTAHTLFPNLKLLYFSSRVYGGYSNGVGSPDNPEPYAYEVGFAVKWAIQDQINGNANLNYNPSLGPVVAPWMSWGTYYWSNGMMARSDGLEWDCEDFSADGTHPSIYFGQPKVATKLLQFLKTDDTTTPWYLSQPLALTATAGNNQTSNPGSTLVTPLTVLASNLNTGAPIPGVSVTFSDGGVGGTFGTPVGTTGGTGTVSTTYTLPTVPQTVSISATSSGYTTAKFSEIAAQIVATLSVVSGGKQVGTVGTALPLPLVMKAKDASGTIVVGAPITFSDGGVGGVFSANPVYTGTNGEASVTYTLPTATKILTITGSNGTASVNATETSVAGPATSLTIVQGNNQTAYPDNKLAKKLIVLVADQYNNGISGITVNFTDNGAGGSFNPASPITVTNGQATTQYTTGSTAETVTISASTTTPALGPVNFTETVIPPK